MTLVELLVVVTVMVILMAVAVPQFKPALESQRTVNAARVVALALERARVRSMMENRAVGVEFMRYHNGHAPNLSLQMRYIREAKPLAQIAPNVRARVTDSNPDDDIHETRITLHQFNGTDWSEEATTAQAEWENKVKAGYKIQFGRQGRSYTLRDPWNLAEPYQNLQLPYGETGEMDGKNALEVLITRPPEPLFSPPVGLPQGTVVDLQFSDFDGVDGRQSFEVGFDVPPTTRGVTLLFSPAGNVEKYAVNGDEKPLPYGGLFYFLVGEWERQGTENGVLSADGLTNLQTPSNTWVTVHPRTGRVSLGKMGPADDPRKYAKEFYHILGEF